MMVALCVGGHRCDVAVHRLVAQAFLGPIPAGHEVNHQNGDKAHNCVANLEYVTRSENVSHAYSAGLIGDRKGELAVWRTKLTNAQVFHIRHLRSQGAAIRAIAKWFPVGISGVSHIVNRHSWGHLP